MSTDGQRITWHKHISENFNRLSRVHERYRRQTDRRAIAYSSRSLKTELFPRALWGTFIAPSRWFEQDANTHFPLLLLMLLDIRCGEVAASDTESLTVRMYFR